jgi:Protein of unknown function (DUF3795)
MGENLNTLLAACGLYCGACYHYRASFYEADRLQTEAARRGQKPVGFPYQGCRSEALYIHPFCARCDIRACADAKGIPHCGLCAEFPCARIKAFQSDGHVHHRDVLTELVNLREKGMAHGRRSSRRDGGAPAGRASAGTGKAVTTAGKRWLPTEPIRHWDENSGFCPGLLVQICSRYGKVVKCK